MSSQAEQNSTRGANTIARHRELRHGSQKLPNLLFRSLTLLGILYGALTLVLITAVEFQVLSALGALVTGALMVLIQFVFGPWILDVTLRWFYSARWVEKNELPEHLRLFVQRVCDSEKLRFPSFAIIDDGAPQAYTYGHYPNNARIVLSRGTLSILSPEESEAVVAHELGHVCHWDMVVMTIAQLVPLIAYSIYRAATRLSDGDKKDRSGAALVAAGAYLVYAASEFVVLWFSRVREYYADQFAGEKTGNPNALAAALVKIGYGLAGRGQNVDAATDPGASQRRQSRYAYGGALGALNIFDRKAALGLVVTTGAKSDAGDIDRERVKDALQWDLWNPWALYYEVQSTHPLVAKRLERLADQAAAMRQEPYIVFDRDQPESYWDEFLVDLIVMLLPMLGLVIGLGMLTSRWLGASFDPHFFGLPLALFGLGYLAKNYLAYRSGNFPASTVADLLKEVKVSPVRTVPVTLRGSVIGRGVPGLIFSEDFVMRDDTGIIFLDYRQPIPLWDFFFGLLKAGKYKDKNIEVRGWYRRAPVPYLEIRAIKDVEDGSERRCYTAFAKLCFGLLVMGLGVVIMLGSQLGL